LSTTVTEYNGDPAQIDWIDEQCQRIERPEARNNFRTRRDTLINVIGDTMYGSPFTTEDEKLFAAEILCHASWAAGMPDKQATSLYRQACCHIKGMNNERTH
jgi:hypothetical protein